MAGVGFALDDAGAGDEEELAGAYRDRADFKGREHASYLNRCETGEEKG